MSIELIARALYLRRRVASAAMGNTQLGGGLWLHKEAILRRRRARARPSFFPIHVALIAGDPRIRTSRGAPRSPAHTQQWVEGRARSKRWQVRRRRRFLRTLTLSIGTWVAFWQATRRRSPPSLSAAATWSACGGWTDSWTPRAWCSDRSGTAERTSSWPPRCLMAPAPSPNCALTLSELKI